MTVHQSGNSSLWSREQDKAFENALAAHPEPPDGGNDDEDQHHPRRSLDRWWEKIAADVPGKTLEQIKQHYELLVDDVNSIESGLVPLPSYTSLPSSSSEASRNRRDMTSTKGSGGSAAAGDQTGNAGKASSRAEQERRKGIAWTEEEHRLFLLGLDKYGKGDWRSISRNFVVTRTPTQVASHAQKYFIRLNSVNKDRRRSSIHDITSVDTGDLSISHHGPITGEGNSPAAAAAGAASASSGKSSKLVQPPHQSQLPSQSIAVGTPVNLPAPIGYSAPMNIGSMGFPLTPTSVRR